MKWYGQAVTEIVTEIMMGSWLFYVVVLSFLIHYWVLPKAGTELPMATKMSTVIYNCLACTVILYNPL
jgi:hypothetical protein